MATSAPRCRYPSPPLDKEGINLAIDDDADPAENTLYKLISALVTEIITEETFASEFRNAGRVSGLRE